MAFKSEGGAHGRTAITEKMLRFDQRLDNARRNVDGRPPLSLIEKWKRDASKALKLAARTAAHRETIAEVEQHVHT